MTILVTGSNGFVGKYLVELLKKDTSDEIIGLDRNDADITDFNSVKKFIDDTEPDRVYHLAGFASGAGKDKDLIFKVNVEGTENILKALKELNKPVKILLASTAYVYGDTPVCVAEDGKIDAKSFYDQSKVEMEKISKKYLSENLPAGKAGIQIIITRATNHTGPGQALGFAVPDFCSQIAKAKSGDVIATGNLDAKRDIFDVRDCVKAYKIVMEKGISGQIYNIGKGEPVSIKNILDEIIKISGKKITYKIDPKRIRPSDIKQNCVDATKVKSLGWSPKIELDKTLKDTYDHYLTLG
jgi:GDP-4-dehydro-6-deoxy-D-mannose reductase